MEYLGDGKYDFEGEVYKRCSKCFLLTHYFPTYTDWVLVENPDGFPNPTHIPVKKKRDYCFVCLNGRGIRFPENEYN